MRGGGNSLLSGRLYEQELDTAAPPADHQQSIQKLMSLRSKPQRSTLNTIGVLRVKSVGFFLWGLWMSKPNFMATHPIVVDIFHSGVKVDRKISAVKTYPVTSWPYNISWVYSHVGVCTVSMLCINVQMHMPLYACIFVPAIVFWALYERMEPLLCSVPLLHTKWIKPSKSLLSQRLICSVSMLCKEIGLLTRKGI